DERQQPSGHGDQQAAGVVAADGFRHANQHATGLTVLLVGAGLGTLLVGQGRGEAVVGALRLVELLGLVGRLRLGRQRGDRTAERGATRLDAARGTGLDGRDEAGRGAAGVGGGAIRGGARRRGAGAVGRSRRRRRGGGGGAGIGRAARRPGI